MVLIPKIANTTKSKSVAPHTTQEVTAEEVKSEEKASTKKK